jgi:capsular polysaccharide biosynthesis protein
MELREIIKILIKYKVALVISVAIGILGGIAFFISPKIYYATGSFYIKRAVDTTRFNYFAYEGYYAQQTGLSYTNTVTALFESPDVRFEALNRLNFPTDGEGLRKYSKMIKVKKMGPQIITLTVKGVNPEEIKNLWDSVSDTTISKNTQININGDPLLSISKISDSPIIKESYRPLWLCIISGAVVAPSLLTLFIALRRYFKWR